MARTADGVVCDGCGRVLTPDLPPAELGDHRDYCGHCKSNREGDYELERQGRRVMASALKADPRLLDADVSGTVQDVADTTVEVADDDRPASRRVDRDREN